MNRRLLPVLLLSAGIATAATPREFVADKVGDARSKLKSAEKRIDDLPGALEQAREGLASAREKLKAVTTKMASGQASLDEAITNTKLAIGACNKMTDALSALPAPTPSRTELVAENGKQCTRLQGIETSLKAASASNAEAVTQLSELDGKLQKVAEKLDGAKSLPSTDQLNDVISMLDTVLKVNKAAMPDFPNIKELK